MADYDSNMIKPVESLKNITGLAPAKRREERKRREQLQQENKQKGESNEGEETLPAESSENKDDPNPDITEIDYCA